MSWSLSWLVLLGIVCNTSYLLSPEGAWGDSHHHIAGVERRSLISSWRTLLKGARRLPSFGLAHFKCYWKQGGRVQAYKDLLSLKPKKLKYDTDGTISGKVGDTKVSLNLNEGPAVTLHIFTTGQGKPYRSVTYVDKFRK